MLAFHVTFGAYGFWLPNDPRGSWSDYVFAPRLRRFGPATKVTTRHSVAKVEHDHRKRLAAKQSLQHPAVEFDDRQIAVVGRSFGKAVEETHLRVSACAVMPDHVHLVYGLHTRKNGSLVGQLKSRGTRQLSVDDLHPFDGTSTPWATGHWEVYLDTKEEVLRAIQYVNQNPVRDGGKPQNWPFVVEFR